MDHVPARSPSRAAMRFGAGLACAVVLPLGAQQYITDAATLTEHGACELQLWHGRRSSSVLPACAPLNNLELSVGFTVVWEDGQDGHFEYVLEGKTLFRRLTTDGWGAALVVGTGRDPALASTAPQLMTYYVDLPLSLSLAGDAVVLHSGTGWLHERVGGHDVDAVTWAARAEVRLRRYVHAVGEVYGAEGSAHAPAEYQAGLRAFARPGRVQLDLSYGARLGDGRRGQGWTFGLTLITPPFL
jgi:hypothetical protein